MTEKILKALDGLKNIRLSTGSESKTAKKEKIAACVQLAHQISTLRLGSQSVPELTVRAIDDLVHLCDDSDADVRNVADESLNRVLRVLSETNALPVQIELYKQIKKNGTARCVRAALTKFASLAHRTRPSKCRGFAAHLTPCIVQLAGRLEDSIQETLTKALENIWPVLGPLCKDNEVKDLIKAFIQNLQSENAVIRRSSASSLHLVVSNSKKCSVMTSLALNWLVDKIVPVSNETPTHTILGMFNAFRCLLPLTTNGDFLEKNLQIYELCLHYASSSDHNIVTMSLETLSILLSGCDRKLRLALLQDGGITKSSIHFTRQSSRLWTRAGSEVSIAGSTAAEDSLIDDETPFQSLNISQAGWNINRLRSLSSSAPTEASLDSDPESVCGSIQSLSFKQDTTDTSIQQKDNEKSFESLSLLPGEMERALDVGSFIDPSLPLLFCCRRLAAYLLDGTGLRSDRSTRVSVKSIALSCLSAVFNLCPQLVSVKLTPYSDCQQRVSDILLLAEHSDPQLRGAVCVVVGSFIGASLLESRGRSVAVFDDGSSRLCLRNLLEILDKGLRDSSATSSRLALAGATNCLPHLLLSDYASQTIPLLKSLPSLVSNSYWLNKVRLVELLCSLEFAVIADVTGSMCFQNEVIENVLLPLLGDEDVKIRRSAAEGLVRIIPEVSTSHSPFDTFTEKFRDHITDIMLDPQSNSFQSLNLPAPYSHLQTAQKTSPKIEDGLSRIVNKLTTKIMVAEDRHEIIGVVEALRLISEKFPPVIYQKSWLCPRYSDVGVSCLLPLLVSHVTSCPFFVELPALENVTVLIGNLYASNAICALKTDVVVRPKVRWAIFSNDDMARISEALLTHVLTVLNVYTQMLAEPPVLKHGRILQMLPTKKSEKEESTRLLHPHYVKVQQALKSALANYKMVIDDSASENLLSVLSATLDATSILLEMCMPSDSLRFAEEVLTYARAVTSLQPVAAVTLTVQAVRSLSSVNLPHFWTGTKEEEGLSERSFYSNVFQIPDNIQADRIRHRLAGISSKRDPMVGLMRVLKQATDRNDMENNVRLLEPMVVVSQQLYTVTADRKLQCAVLNLITQLVQVKVNYCGIDNRLHFRNFVKSQIELIERGQMGQLDGILPCIFKFFVCLSYVKKDVEPLMRTPDILQMFVGLMANEQDNESHCVPGLLPVVKDVFGPRHFLGDERKEAETQKEVLLATLLRLAMYRQVLEALHFVVLSEEQVGSHVVAAILPLIASRKIRLEEDRTRCALGTLVSSLPVSVFNTSDALVRVMFLEPPDRHQDDKEMARWVAGQAILFEVLLSLKEDVVLSRIQNLVHPVDLSAFLAPPTVVADPLLVAPPSVATSPVQSLARLIVLTLSRTAALMLESLEACCLENVLSEVFVVVFRLLQSGSYHETTKCIQSLLSIEKIASGISELFLQLSSVHPLLTSQYLYLLGLLGCADPRLWLQALSQSSSFSQRLVQRGAVLAIADYLDENTWDMETLDLLLENLNVVLEMFDNAPIRELLTEGAARSAPGRPILNAISELNLSTPSRVAVALKVLKVIHDDHCGAVIKLLISKFLRLPFLALTRQTSALACRKIEYLMTLPTEKVEFLLSKECFKEVRLSLEGDHIIERYPALAILVTKLGKQCYQELEIPGTQLVKSLDKNASEVFSERWFWSHVKEQCCGSGTPGQNLGKLLLKLSLPLLDELFGQPDFQVPVLADCFLAVQKVVQDSRKKLIHSDFPLYAASRSALMERVRAIVSGLSGPDAMPDPVWIVCPVLTVYLESLPSWTPTGFYEEEMGVVLEYSMHCLLRVAGALTSPHCTSSPSEIQSALSCVKALLELQGAQNWLSKPEHRSIADSALNASVVLVRGLVLRVKSDGNLDVLMEFLMMDDRGLPEYLDKVLRRVSMLICRLPVFWSQAVAIPEVGDVEAEVLQLFTRKISVIGWSSRAQFEEIFYTLLGGLSIEHSDASLVSQAGIAALEGISVLLQSLLLLRLGDPASPIGEHGRDLQILRECADGLPRLTAKDGFQRDLESDFSSSLEHRPGLLSVEQLWSATQLAATSPDGADDSSKRQIADLGLDLVSSTKLLLELFQRFTNENRDQHFLAAALRTGLVLSDQFKEPSQFRALLDVVLAIDAATSPHDLPLLPLCILVAAKCIAALLPGAKQYSRLKEIMTRSDSIECRLATVQALLYLVQSPVVYWRLQPSRHLGNSMFYVEDNAAVTQLVETFLPVAIEILLQFAVDRSSCCDIYEVHGWSLMSYLLLHYRQELGEHWQEFIDLLIGALSANTSLPSVQTVVLHATERLLVADCLDEKQLRRIMAVSQTMISQEQVLVRRHGYQLLMTASFISKRRANTEIMDPDTLMEAVVRLGVLLARLKKSPPEEAYYIAEAVGYLLKDLQPFDILSKLVQEFLTPQHPYPNILAGLLFQIMENADLVLLHDWVVFSLPSLVHGVNLPTGIRTLTCLFLSASRDPWLRAAFPLTQNACGIEPENYDLLVDSATHFYSQLKTPKQRDEFRAVFLSASNLPPVYVRILESLSS